MIVIHKKRIQVIISCILIAIFAFSFQVANKSKEEQQNTIETTATPVSGKTIVIDAGHGVPDEGDLLLHKENKQLTFYK